MPPGPDKSVTEQSVEVSTPPPLAFTGGAVILEGLCAVRNSPLQADGGAQGSFPYKMAIVTHP